MTNTFSLPKWAKRFIFFSLLWVSLLLFFITAVTSTVTFNVFKQHQQVNQLHTATNSLLLEAYGLSEQTLIWQPVVEEIASQYGIREYVPILLAIMEVESGGRGGDPMQSSESKGLPMNTIQSPRESIIAGVEHFKKAIDKVNTLKVDFWSAVGGYNFGTAYINYVANHGKVHRLDIAEQYSKTVVAVSLGNTTGETYPYHTDVSIQYEKPYLYVNGGNYYYVERVKEHLMVKSKTDNLQFDQSFVFPLDSKAIVTSEYASFRSIMVKGKWLNQAHNGIDLVYADGRVHGNILAVASGTVIKSGYDSYGNLVVVLKHHEHLYTGYYHLSRALVQEGDTVVQGQVIGLMGSTGNSTGEHLHLAISKGLYTDYINPRAVINFD